MFKPGSIRKIEVTNFVTYSHVEFYPGPNLNMVIGPNGTGKSTLVSAIILGLGGHTKTIGRATKISDFIKHNCNQATINIFLENPDGGKYVKITRLFTMQEKSTWKLNDETTNQTKILQCIQKFNIQVNNLCQFLPQDRVHEFAKLNKQDLLKQTQIALCRDDLIDKQDKLIQKRLELKTLVEGIEKHENDLRKAREDNGQLEGKIKNFRKKKKFVENIENIERKIAWMNVEQMEARVQDIKQDKVRATEIHAKYKKALKPIEAKVEKFKKHIIQLEKTNSNLTNVMKACEASIAANEKDTNQMKSKVRLIKAEINKNIDEIQIRTHEIETLEEKLKNLSESRIDLLKQSSDDQKTYEECSLKLQSLTVQLRKVDGKKEEIIQQKQCDEASLRAMNNEIKRLDNVRELRLQKLQKLNNDAYQAVLWLRQNKHLFANEVFEPMMVEINVLDPKNSVFIENILPIRDRIAFTCVDKNDMNLLIGYLRESQKLSVNIIHSGDENTQMNYQPDIPIEQLKRYGFYTYLYSIFSAPEPIKRYLCKTYRIHKIPIGTDKINSCYEQIPKQITLFFSDKYRFSISYSRYTGEKSSRQAEIRSDTGLSISVDVKRLEALKEQKNDAIHKIQKHEQHLNTINSQYENLNEAVRTIRSKLTEVTSKKQKIASIQAGVEKLKLKLQDLKSKPIDITSINQQAIQKIKKQLDAIERMQLTIEKELTKSSLIESQIHVNSLKITRYRQFIAFLENDIKDQQQKCTEVEETLRTIAGSYSSAVAEALTLLNKAKSLSGGFTPNDEGFNVYKTENDQLPSNIELLMQEKEQISSRIRCLSAADDEEIREYEERVRLIAELEKLLEGGNRNIVNLKEDLEKYRDDWLIPLRELVDEISEKFSGTFRKIGCVGEVSVYTGENESDYSNYGISIKITFRNGEPLQELNRVTQSGGERAVVTAAYMLSLQELTPVPFRCVDEINQGMDSNNERKIFETLLELTNDPNSSQYFFVTPKLLPNLKYSPLTKINFVHNGPFVTADRKWAFSSFCNPDGLRIN